jgi:hypothetical protein
MNYAPLVQAVLTEFDSIIKLPFVKGWIPASAGMTSRVGAKR